MAQIFLMTVNRFLDVNKQKMKNKPEVLNNKHLDLMSYAESSTNLEDV